jgi:hypothetical protein
MKTSKYILTVLLLSAGWLPVRAQLYNGAALTNSGGLISDWTTQVIIDNDYSGTGSTGSPSGYGVFEHRGQSGTGANAAFINNGSYGDFGVQTRDYFLGPNGAPGQQEIAGTNTPTFSEVFFQNGAGQLFDITNLTGIDVLVNASFENGITTTVRSNIFDGAIRFLDNAAYTNTALGDAQHVNGYVTKRGNDAFTFPVGSGTDLRTLAISAPATATDEYSVAWIAGDPGANGDPSNSNAMHATTAVTGNIRAVSTAGQWDWIATSTGTGAGLTITVSIPAGITAPAANLRLVGWNGTSWVDLSGAPNATGNTEGSTLSGTMIAGIQAVAVGQVAPDLTPTVDIDGLSFSPASTPRDFVVNIFEINGILAINPITVRLPKLSAFTITYLPVSGISNVFGGVANQNSNWSITENASFITATALPGVNIAANGTATLGFTIARKPGVTNGTTQNLSTTVIGQSGGEVKTNNNNVSTAFTATP